MESITYNNNTITFDIESRIDWAGSQKLKKITVLNSNSNIVKTCELNYDYFETLYLGKGYKTKGNYIGEKDYRLKLMGLTIDQVQNYQFEYNSENLPSKNSFAVDLWGYYNGQTQNKSLIANLEDFEPSSSLNVTHASAFSRNKPNIKYSIERFTKACSLEKIRLPTGGLIQFHYSLNEFDNYKVPSDPSKGTTRYYGNGLKIDSIITWSSNNVRSSKTAYTYEQGKLQIPTQNYYSKHEGYTEITPIGNEGIINTYSGNFLNINSNNFYIPNITGSGNGVGYSKVSTIQYDINNATANGKQVQYFVNNPDILHPLPYGDLIDFIPSYHKGFENGTVLSEEIYKNNEIQKKTTYDYQVLNPTNTIEYNGRTTYLGRWGVDCGYDQVLVCYYPIYKPQTLLTKKTTEDFHSGTSVTLTESFFYNENHLLNYKGTEPASSTHSVEDRIYYPADIISSSQYDAITKEKMGKLIELNRIDEKIKIESSIRNMGHLTTKTSYIEYQEWNKFLPTYCYTSLGNVALSLECSFKYNSSSQIIEETDKSTQVTAYIWSYNKQYVVAKVQNASYVDVSNAIPGFLSFIENSISPSDTQLNSFSNSLRAALPNSQITTYTYKPLVGMTTATDPRGITTFYEYDPLNRLQYIKDKDNKILQSFDYNYKQ